MTDMNGYGYICIIIFNIISPGYERENLNNFQESHHIFSERHKRQSACKVGEVACKSGQCISEDYECDGKANCDDQSDEANCANYPCTSNLFRCAYGACITQKAVCDGKRDCMDNSDETVPDCVTNKPSPCKNGEFYCNSGECINEERLCDGKADCSDNSDETVALCSKIPCNARIFFRCDYGACLRKDKKCNGVKDCFDNSDEKNCPKEPQSHVGCLIPPHPKHGEYKLGETIAIPGQYAPIYSVLVVHCNPSFNTNPPVARGAFPFCTNNKWTIPPPSCARACRPLVSTETTTVSCKHNGELLDNCENPVQGTVASFKCASFYELPAFYQNPDSVCWQGHWDFIHCIPVCGEKSPQKAADALVIGGVVTAIKTDYPWHVGIFNATNDNICGGSIITFRIVLSAAHCFTDSIGNVYPIGDYKVIAGKYYRTYDDPRDENAQESSIRDIFVPERYKASENYYEADLAVLVLADKLKASLEVQPVCVDWRNIYERRQLIENNVGTVVGWGQTVLGSHPSTELKELQVPYIPYKTCVKQVPNEFKNFLTYDKICAGYLSKMQAVCQGDSGGGLAFQKDENRFYIRGVVSTSPATRETGVRTCDPNQYATYTLISKYLQLISDIEIQNRL